MDKTSNWPTKTTHGALNIESGKRMFEYEKLKDNLNLNKNINKTFKKLDC